MWDSVAANSPQASANQAAESKSNADINANANPDAPDPFWKGLGEAKAAKVIELNVMQRGLDPSEGLRAVVLNPKHAAIVRQLQVQLGWIKGAQPISASQPQPQSVRAPTRRRLTFLPAVPSPSQSLLPVQQLRSMSQPSVLSASAAIALPSTLRFSKPFYLEHDVKEVEAQRVRTQLRLDALPTSQNLFMLFHSRYPDLRPHCLHCFAASGREVTDDRLHSMITCPHNRTLMMDLKDTLRSTGVKLTMQTLYGVFNIPKRSRPQMQDPAQGRSNRNPARDEAKERQEAMQSLTNLTSIYITQILRHRSMPVPTIRTGWDQLANMAAAKWRQLREDRSSRDRSLQCD